jgi:hypothetical protein
MIKVITTSKSLSFRVQGKRVQHDKPTLVHIDNVVLKHIRDGSLERVIVAEEKKKVEKPIKKEKLNVK